jgi:aryl-alcohol dehydrogenase-like predicted oxidoreductase
MRRRNFLRMGLWSVFGLSHLEKLTRTAQETTSLIKRKPLLRRILGRTGEQISIIGLGGVVVMNETQDTANQIVHEAIEHGVNYFDVAPSYDNAEERLGVALKPFRDRIFLACKTLERTRSGAEEELNRSLVRLQTDHFDLYQLHGFTETADVTRVFRRGGAMETLIQAKEDGRIKHLGFSAHSAEAALNAMDEFDFDSILFPINYVCYYKAQFGPAVVRKAMEKKMGILGIKAMARQPWPNDERKNHWPKNWYEPILDPKETDLALRFSLSEPVTAIIPPGDVRLFRRALEIAHSFTPINDEEERQLRLLALSLEPLFKSRS